MTREIHMSREENRPNPKQVTLQCCEDARNNSTVFLAYKDLLECNVSKEIKPVWMVRGWYTPYDCLTYGEVKFCPHCATPVPEIEPSKIKGRIQKITDGGYYCDTCKKRLMECQCLPPTQAWKIKEEGVAVQRVPTYLKNIIQKIEDRIAVEMKVCGTNVTGLQLARNYIREETRL